MLMKMLMMMKIIKIESILYTVIKKTIKRIGLKTAKLHDNDIYLITQKIKNDVFCNLWWK